MKTINRLQVLKAERVTYDKNRYMIIDKKNKLYYIKDMNVKNASEALMKRAYGIFIAGYKIKE